MAYNFNPLQQMFPFPIPQRQQPQAQVPQMNEQQFKQMLPNLNQNTLSMLVQQAKMQGISEADIQSGLDWLNSIK